MITPLLAFQHVAAAGRGLGKLLQSLGVPPWLIWIVLGLWLLFVIVRRFSQN